MEGDDSGSRAVHAGLGLGVAAGTCGGPAGAPRAAGRPPSRRARTLAYVRITPAGVSARTPTRVAPEPVLLDLLDLELERLERDRRQAARDLVEVDAGVEQRAERGVAGDPGDAVEVGDPHRVATSSPRRGSFDREEVDRILRFRNAAGQWPYRPIRSRADRTRGPMTFSAETLSLLVLIALGLGALALLLVRPVAGTAADRAAGPDPDGRRPARGPRGPGAADPAARGRRPVAARRPTGGRRR